MPLLDRFSHPPGHFRYREPKTGMEFGQDGVGFYDVADALQKHRNGNPRLFTAEERNILNCEQAVDDFTCQRLKNSAKWCQQPYQPGEQNAQPKAKKSSSERGCSSCGGRKKHG